VPGDVDVLLLVAPQDLDTKQRFAVDQYLMRGGAVILCAGAFSLDTSGPGGLSVRQSKTGLEELLASWGVKVVPKLVLDPQNESFPVPVERNVMGITVRELQLIAYPFFVDVRQSGMAEQSPIVAGLPSVTIHWASPLELSGKEGLTAQTLLRSSSRAWLQESTNVQPDFDKHPQKGFGTEGEAKSRPLAVALSGTFTSTFADKPSPLLADGTPASKPAKKAADASGIKKSPSTARLIVVGSADFIKDAVLNLSRQTGSERFANNLQLLQNLVDWSVADIDLLSIRSRGTYARTLKPLEESARSGWEWGNYLLVVLALAVIVGFNVVRRRSVQPLRLAPASKEERS